MILIPLLLLLLLLCCARSDPDLQSLLSSRKAAWYAARPHLAGSGVYEKQLNEDIGVPLDFDELMKSMVYAPADVPVRWGSPGV